MGIIWTNGINILFLKIPEVLETVTYIVFTVLLSVMQFQYNNIYQYYTAAAWLLSWLPTLDVRTTYVWQFHIGQNIIKQNIWTYCHFSLAIRAYYDIEPTNKKPNTL